MRPIAITATLSPVTPQHPSTLPTAAARNNADWCAAVCRTHGIEGIVDALAWTSDRRTPPLYPDAVTLHPGITAGEVLSRVDTTAPGCAVKDSFAGLDLAPAGFGVLFDAHWIHRPADIPVPPRPAGLHATPVRSARRLRDWQAAWHGTGEPPDIFRPTLLGNLRVRIVAVYDDDRLAGGGALYHAAGMVGVTNLFSVGSQHPVGVWCCLLAAATHAFPGVSIVGYERGDGLAQARQLGFSIVGQLRVWSAVS